MSSKSDSCVVPTLTRICMGVLIRYRDALSDVGWLDVAALKTILSHCTPEQLGTIEDCTRQGSGRDLSWYTWDCWHRFYEQKFGTARASSAVVKPLPGVQPPDYTPPVGVAAPTADWRRMLERDIDAEKERAQQMSSKLRNMYNAANKDKASRSVEVCAVTPPPKRRRTVLHAPGGGSRGSIAPTNPADKAKAKMLHDIGMSSAPVKRSSNQDVRQVGRTHKVTVTRTVTVHKASPAPGAAALAARAVKPSPSPGHRLQGSTASASPGNPASRLAPSPAGRPSAPTAMQRAGPLSAAAGGQGSQHGSAARSAASSGATPAGGVSRAVAAGQLIGQKRALEAQGVRAGPPKQQALLGSQATSYKARG